MSRRAVANAQAPAPKRCAVYTRKSTTAGLEMDFNSLDAQYEACVAYIARQANWALIPERFDDGGFTGANTDRPAFQRMMRDVAAGTIDVVVVYKVDRLSRSILDFAKVMEQLDNASASFVSVTQNFTTADAMGRLTLNVLLSFAQFEREMIADRTRDKIAAARRRGKWTGGGTPFGYKIVDRRLVAHEGEAPIVSEAFALFLTHRRMAVVARLLNEQCLLPRGMKSRPARGGLRWTKDGIGCVLRNVVYGGFITCGDDLVKGEHEPLVDEATYRAARAILEGAEHTRVHPRTNAEYLLRGLLRCGACDTPMIPASSLKRGVRLRYYRCATRDKFGRGACAAKELPAGAIEAFVAERVAEAVSEAGFVDEVDAAMRTRAEERRRALLEVYATLPDRIATSSAAVTGFVNDLAALSGGARAIVEAKMKSEAARLAAAEAQLAETERALNAIENVLRQRDFTVAALRDFGRVWEAMIPENRGRLLRAVVRAVRVFEREQRAEVELVDFAATGEARAA